MLHPGPSKYGCATLEPVLYVEERSCICYICLPVDESKGSKHVHVEEIVKNEIKFNRSAFYWSVLYDVPV